MQQASLPKLFERSSSLLQSVLICCCTLCSVSAMFADRCTYYVFCRRCACILCLRAPLSSSYSSSNSTNIKLSAACLLLLPQELTCMSMSAAASYFIFVTSVDSGRRWRAALAEKMFRGMLRHLGASNPHDAY